jgi:hypothetical protein
VKLVWALITVKVREAAIKPMPVSLVPEPEFLVNQFRLQVLWQTLLRPPILIGIITLKGATLGYTWSSALRRAIAEARWLQAPPDRFARYGNSRQRLWTYTLLNAHRPMLSDNGMCNNQPHFCRINTP